jgi:hypothetical protein
MQAGTWRPAEKAPLETAQHDWGGRVSHDAVRVSHEAVTRLRRVVRRRMRVDCQGNVFCTCRVVSGRKRPFPSLTVSRFFLHFAEKCGTFPENSGITTECISRYQDKPAHTPIDLVHTGIYWYVLVHTSTSKRFMYRLNPCSSAYFFACLTAALQAYSKRNVDMKLTGKTVPIHNKMHFLPDYLALDDGSTAPVRLRLRLRP